MEDPFILFTNICSKILYVASCEQNWDKLQAASGLIMEKIRPWPNDGNRSNISGANLCVDTGDIQDFPIQSHVLEHYQYVVKNLITPEHNKAICAEIVNCIAAVESYNK